MKRIILSFIIVDLSIFCVYSQNMEGFNDFRKNILSGFQNDREIIFTYFNSFRDSINAEYANFLRTTWSDFSLSEPIPQPKEEIILPPVLYTQPEEHRSITVSPNITPVIATSPKPQPVEPIHDNPHTNNEILRFSFYGLSEKIRKPLVTDKRIILKDNESVARAWESLCNKENDNTLYDLLKIRDKNNLCDWGYLAMIYSMASQCCKEKNNATMLAAYLYSQSGYQMRLGRDNNHLILLFGSQHQIYEKPFIVIDGLKYYPYTTTTSNLNICPVSFDGEKPMSLIIDSEQKLGPTVSEVREIKSTKFKKMIAMSSVPIELIKFYDSYPTSAIGENMLSRWAMYANTPLSNTTKDILYPSLRASLSECNEIEAVNKLLNWVQTGFLYESDEKVWGHDRAFFAEETLYYPYADCEDRAILFSRLVRDLLNLDVALIYYPGHLATAVAFSADTQGDTIIVGGKRFVICDPTYIGAPVGTQMPKLDYKNAIAILLNK